MPYLVWSFSFNHSSNIFDFFLHAGKTAYNREQELAPALAEFMGDKYAKKSDVILILMCLSHSKSSLCIVMYLYKSRLLSGSGHIVKRRISKRRKAKQYLMMSLATFFLARQSASLLSQRSAYQSVCMFTVHLSVCISLYRLSRDRWKRIMPLCLWLKKMMMKRRLYVFALHVWGYFMLIDVHLYLYVS